MLKKTKLYSLLLIIVLSTVVGVFGFEGTAGAQEWDGNVITHNGETFSEGNCADGEHPLESEGVIIYTTCGVSPLLEVPTIWFEEGSDTTEVVTAKYAEWEYDAIEQEYTNALNDEADITFTEPRDPEAPTNDDGGEEESSYCQIKGIGWLICPVIVFLAEVTDQSYSILDNTLLKVEPLALPGSTDNAAGLQLYDSWKMMRDFANVIFIIGFLFIVFSQITNIGISNYGIKRLLPKIIIAAILVNISYYICVVAVDLSNILGNSLRGLLAGATIENQGGGPFSFTVDTGDGAAVVTSWTDLVYLVIGASGQAVATVAAGALLYAFAPVLLPMIVGAVLAVLTVVIALTLRQALIVILVVISPLAFVALLLPNTESYFQKWKSIFTAMLMIYPIISIVFGASAMASSILMATDDFPVQLVGAGVSVIPLFLTPIVMKVSGGLLNRWVGMVNDPTKGPVDGMRNNLKRRGERWEGNRRISALDEKQGSKDFGKNTLQGRIMGSRYRRAARNDAIDAGVKTEANRASGQYVAGEIRENEGNNQFAKDVAGSNDQAAVDRAQARAQSVVEKAEDEDVQAAHSTIQHMDTAGLDAELLKTGNSDAKIAAILERLVKLNDAPQIEGYVNSYARDGEQTVITRTLANALEKNGPQFLKAPDIDNVSRGQSPEFREVAKNNLSEGVMSERKMSVESNKNLEYSMTVAQEASTDPTRTHPVTGGPDTRAIENLEKTAQQLLANPTLRGDVKHNRGQISQIAGTPPPLPPPGPPPPGPGMRPGDV